MLIRFDYRIIRYWRMVMKLRQQQHGAKSK